MAKYFVAIQADGKIVAAGYYENGLKNNFALVRYDLDGSIDTTFGSMGVVIQAIGDDDFITAVALDGTSKIVVVGYAFDGIKDVFALMRFWQ